jgi:sulfate transport system ATP-binding protein
MSVELRGVVRRFGATPAVRGVDLSISNGEFVALLGPSGSGKTTLLRIVAGLEIPEAGQVIVGGRDMEGVPARKRSVGFVFQNYALFRHMTVAENVGFGLRVRSRVTRPGRREIKERVADLIELVQLPGLGERYPDQLSGGQRQRVALARALAIEPRVLLLDEPFGALDAPVRRDLRTWLRELHDRTRLTTILVTHDQEEALDVADRVAVMNQGLVVQVGTPAALMAAPADPFLYRFLGDSVSLDCTIRGGRAFPDGLGLPPLPSSLPDGKAVAMLRPHEIGLVPGAGLGRVVSVATAGPLTRVAVSIGDRTIEVLTADDPPHVGTACTLDLHRAILYPRP